MCLAKLFPDHGIHLAEMVFGLQRRLLGSKAAPKNHAPVSPGSCNAATITLLSDGRRTTRVDALRHVYQQIGSTIQTQNRETELTALLALLAAGLVVAGAALSLLWFGRVA